MATIDLKTGGMHCSSCSMLIDMTVGDLPGVQSAESDYAKGKTRVEYDPKQISPEDIITAIEQAGYTACLAA
jgi:copper chaperone CopZ